MIQKSILTVPAVVIVGYNRAQSLERLLSSVLSAEYPSDINIPLVISLDYCEEIDIAASVKEIVHDISWPYGEVTVKHHRSSLGLRDHVLNCGDLAYEYGAIVLLEDDLFVSPHFYNFARESLQYYKEDTSIAGISLYSQSYNETAKMKFHPVIDEYDVFFMKLPSSWGQCWTSVQWNKFRTWYDTNNMQEKKRALRLPGNIRKWPESSWKKEFTIYLNEKDKYFVYPRVGLSTNFCDKGVHVRKKTNIMQSLLLYSDKDFKFCSLGESLSVYDSFHEIKPDRLQRMCPKLAGYDFDVDFYGTKRIADIDSDYLITSKRSSHNVMSFGLELKPVELNVVYQVMGGEICLVERQFCEEEMNVTDNAMLQYFFGIPHDTIDPKRFDEKLKAMESSISWRLTRPLRYIRKIFLKMRKSGDPFHWLGSKKFQ